MKKTFAILLSVLLLLSLCACGASAKGQSARDSAYYVSAPAEEPMPAPQAAIDRKSTRLNSSHPTTSRMPSSA